jgi:hypothetical protein
MLTTPPKHIRFNSCGKEATLKGFGTSVTTRKVKGKEVRTESEDRDKLLYTYTKSGGVKAPCIKGKEVIVTLKHLNSLHDVNLLTVL